jgi:6-pyruvoyltetrahydropterin/6-carboxytetrahydropterin synthase
VFTLTKEFKFEAAHKLPKHDGKCRRLHGHSWRLRIVLADEMLHVAGPKSGMVQDFADIKSKVQPLVDRYLDHHYLNETTKLANPTSEEIARWVFDKLKRELLPLGLAAVEVDETCTSSCRYEP